MIEQASIAILKAPRLWKMGNIRMMTDKEDHNVEAEEEPKNSSEIELSNQELAKKKNAGKMKW